MTCHSRELHEDCNPLHRKTIEHSGGRASVFCGPCFVRGLAPCRWAVGIFRYVIFSRQRGGGPNGAVTNS